MRLIPLATLFLGTVTAGAQQHPIPEAATWWRLTSDLSNDSMQGRDTGTEAYDRAARYVADHLRQSGLKPAGENGTFFQSVPMREVDLDTARSTIAIETTSGDATGIGQFKLLEQVTLQPTEALPKDLRANMVFLGYGLSIGGRDETSPTRPVVSHPASAPDLHNSVAVYFAGVPAGLTPADRQTFLARRAQRLATSGAAATVAILDPGGSEPFHWPAAYARTVTLAGASAAPSATPSLRISVAAAQFLFDRSGHDANTLLRDAEHGDPLPFFDLHATLALHLEITARDIASPNILAILPGSAATPDGAAAPNRDPALATEFVALSAHLDGYGFGTPVNGDSLYNGALDDAAYVATLLEFADTIAHAPPAQQPRRSLLFCIFTGEEKGLLGSEFFTHHPTVPLQQIVADLNLDQLRPIFPLRALTMEGLSDSTLGDTARAVAARYRIELRPDHEPERNFFRRADNYNFVRAGIPIASFIFGYDPGSPEERIYRDWYARRYHKPQDDLSTPIDWRAAVTFNRFYRDLALTIANSPTRPRWSATSPNAPHP